MIAVGAPTTASVFLSGVEPEPSGGPPLRSRRQVQMGRRVVRVDLCSRTVSLADGEQLLYDYLISTMPLDRLLAMLVGQPALSAKAARFRYSSSHIIGVGVARPSA